MRLSLKKLSLFATTILVLLSFQSSFAQSAGDYRTRASGNWSTVATWERYDGSTWVSSPSQGTPTNSAGTITILNTHTVTVTANVTIDQAIINSGGQITVNSGITLTVRNGSGTDLSVTGTLRNTGTVTNNGTIVFNSGGKYQHNLTTTAGTIPTSTWSTGSTCEVIGYTSLATLGNIGFTQNFYNFTWNCPGQTQTLSMAGGLRTVLGNFSIVSTGSGVLQLANSVSANRTLAITGNYSQTGGTLTLLGTSGSYYESLNVAGNFSISGGTIQKGSGDGRIYFTGTTQQTYSKTGGAFSGAIPVTINANAIVDFGTSILDGSSGTFTLSSGATIITSNSNGLGASGSIQTSGTKSFNSGANYQFKGASTGSFTTTTANTVNNFTVNSSGTTLAQDFIVNGALTFTAGSLTLGTYNLTIAAAGSVSGYSSSAFIKTTSTGQLKRTVASTAVIFPVGNGSYNPITFTNSGTSDVYGVRVADGTIPATIANADQTVNRRWVVTEAVASGSDLAVVAQYNTGEEGANFNAATYNFLGFYNGSSWVQSTATKAGSNPYTFTSATNFSSVGDLTSGTKYFAVGRDNGFISPTKLVITSISPATPVINTSYSVTVQAQDANGQPAMVGTATTFTLAKSSGTSTSPIATGGTIAVGSNSLTLNGPNFTGSGTTVLTATRTAGLSLTAGSSSSFNVLAAEPTQQGSSLLFSNINGTSMTIDWTAGNGTNSIVLVKSASAVNGSPVDGTTYTASTTFGSGTQIGTGNYVVYSGSSNSVSITGLTAGTDYYVAVYSYNGSGDFSNFLTASPVTDSQRSLSTGDYRSKATGAWTTNGSWERWSGSAWVAATATPTSSDGAITIRNGHTITTSSNITVDQLTVETGGTLTISSNTLTINDGTGTDAEINGTVNVVGTFGATGGPAIWINGGTIKNSGSSNLSGNAIYTFNNNGVYEHARNGGAVPTATWDTGATCMVSGIVGTDPSGFNGQTFHNLTWNCTGQTSDISMGVTSMTVAGDFRLTSTNSKTLYLRTNDATLTIGGDYIQTGGIFSATSGNDNIGTINLAGNFSQTGGTLTTGSGNSTTATRVIFNNSGTQTFTASNNTIGTQVDFTVNSGSTISLGTSVVTGRSFTLSSGAGLETGNTAGITSSGSTGSIQVSGTRSFSSAANYTYNGSSAQATGNGLPSAVNNLIINNTAGVNLTSNCTVGGTLSLASGLFNIGTTTLTVNTDITKTSGTLSSSATGTVAYNQLSNGQTVISGTYGNITFSNYNKVFESTSYNTDGSLGTANIFIAGTLSLGNASGHNTAESIISFNGSTAQDVPAELEYFSIYLTGAGTKNIEGNSPTEFKVNWNLDVNAAVTFDKVSSIYVVKNVSGSQAFSTGAIPVTIGDDWKNTATGTIVTGMYTYNGESGVNLEVGALNYKDLTITASRGSSFPVVASFARGAASVAHTLLVNPDCELASNGNLTLIAADNVNANVAPLIGNAVITGDVNVQSFIKGGLSTLRGTRAMSAPISSANIYEQLKSYMIVTGPSGVAGGFDLGGSGQPNAVTITNYNESALASQSAFTPIENLDDAANPAGVGFLLFFRGSRANPSTKLNAPYAVPESVTVIYSGPLNQGDIEIPVPNSNNPGDAYNGYFLAGNPYASIIDIQDVRTASSGINPIVTIVKAGQSAATYHAVLNQSTNSGSRYIQPGQAFYVSAVEGGGVLRFNESVKENADDIAPGRLLSRPDKFVLNEGFSNVSAARSDVSTISSSEAKMLRMNLADAVNKEEALIGFRDDFSAQADINDARYFSGTTVNLSSLSSDNVPLAINTLSLESVREIPLSVNTSTSGTVKLSFTEVPQTDLYEIALKDNLLNTLTPVNAATEYSFQIDKTISTTYGTNRLALVITPVSTLAVQLKNFSVKKVSAGAELQWNTLKETDSRNFVVERSVDGKTFTQLGVVNAAGNSSSVLAYSFIDNNPVTGVNYYRLKKVSTSGETSYSEIASITWKLTEQVQIAVYPNPVQKVLTVEAGTGAKSLSLSVFDMQGRKLIASEGNQLNVEDLVAGTYMVKVSDLSTGNLLGTKKFIKK